MLALAAAALAIPLHFEPNRGQWDSRIRFEAATPRHTLELSDTAVAVNFHGGSLRMKIPRADPEGVEQSPGRSNYYFGPDPAKWFAGIPNFARIRYRAVFHGVDLAIYGSGQNIEYDWIVVPGADPRSIRFSFSGAVRMRIDPNGDLVLDTAVGQVRQTRPRISQSGREIRGRFVLSDGAVGFEIGRYDKREPLVIDPVLVVNTSFGGNGSDVFLNGGYYRFQDTGTGIAADSSGAIYIAGITYSLDFPLVNPISSGPSCPANEICTPSGFFVSKLSPDGGTLLYSTYIGGFASTPPALAADPSGVVYVTGATSGSNFPGVTEVAGGTDAFLLRLDPNGGLLGTRLFGGSGEDVGTSIVFGPDGSVYLAGTTSSPDFPVTPNAYRAPSTGTSNVFVVKIGFNSLFGPTGGTVVYSAIAGPGTSAAVAADLSGSAYVAAATNSTAWQTTSGVVQPSCAGSTCADIAIAKLDPLGEKLIYGTYLGGSQTENLGGIAVDASGSAYISGTTSSMDFPVTSGAFQTHSPNSSPDGETGFVAKISPDATHLIYATFLGGSAKDQPTTIAVDSSGNAYAGGKAVSSDFPLLYPVQFTLIDEVCQGYNPLIFPNSFLYSCPAAGYVTVLNPGGNALVWSTYLGSGMVNALALDSAGNVYATGVDIAVTASTLPSVGVVKIGPGGSGLDVAANSFQNAASYASGVPLSGGLASAYVRGLNISGPMIAKGSPIPVELAGVSISVAGVPAPILSISSLASGAQQINFQIPFETPIQVSSSGAPAMETFGVEIRYGGSSAFGFPQTTGPGVFMLSDGAPAVQHSADYSLVTTANPAHAGETIVVYATGLGEVSPPVPTGVAASGPASAVPVCQPFQASVGTILYAGLAPGYVGLYQINIQLPENLAAGVAQIAISTSCLTFPPSGLPSNTFDVPVQ